MLPFLKILQTVAQLNLVPKFHGEWFNVLPHIAGMQYVLNKNELCGNINNIYVRWTVLFSLFCGCVFLQIDMKMPILNVHLDRKIAMIIIVWEKRMVPKTDAFKCTAWTHDSSNHADMLAKHSDEDASWQPYICSFLNV